MKKLRKHSMVLAAMIAVAVGLFLFTAVGHAEEQKVYKFRMQSFFGPGSPAFDESLPRFVKNVKEMTNGQIDITLYPPGSLVPSFELFKSMGRGVVDMGLDAGVYWMGFMPIGELVWGWPFTFEHMQEHDYFYNVYGGIEILRKATAQYGVHVLVNAVHNKYGSVTSAKPIKRLADFKGMKIRSFSAYAKTMERFGASTMTVPGEEMYTAMATGVIDGATWGAPADSNAFKLYEVAKYYTMPAWHPQCPIAITMNMKKWKALPNHLKKILQTAALEYGGDVAARTWYKDAVTLEEWIEKRGVIVHEFPKEDLAKARAISMELLDKVAEKSPYCKEHVTLLKKYLKELGYKVD